MPEILPHPIRGTLKIGTERIMPVFGEIRAAEGASDETPMITVQGTDGSEDRHGTPIDPKGWRFADYLRNPCALWAHGSVAGWPAVGATKALRSVGGAWDFDIELMLSPWRHLDVNMPAFIWEAYRDFGLCAVSVSFIPKDWEDYESKTIPSFFSEGVRYKVQELTEISFVNVPSNRNALAKAFERRRDAGKTDMDALSRMLGYEISPIILRTTEPKTEDRVTIADTRKRFAEILARCGGCDSYYGTMPAEPVSPEVQAAEIATINDLSSQLLDQIATAMIGWTTSEHERLRNMCASLVSGNMYLFDTLAQCLYDWYDQDIGATVPPLDFAEMESAVSNAAPFAFDREGRMAASMRVLRSLLDHVLTGEEGEAPPPPAEWPKGTLIIKNFPGYASSEHDAMSHLISVARKPDAPSSGEGGESHSPGRNAIRVLLEQK